MEHRIDATNRVLGRLATEIALLLCGKTEPRFDPSKTSDTRVLVYNTDKLRVTGRKPMQKQYRRHSGYPGGLKEETLRSLMERDSKEVVLRAVKGMLPKNRLQQRRLRNLVLERGNKS